MAELRERYDGCPTGSAVWTEAGNLPARWVIHAVGPRWQGGGHDEERLLRSAYRESLARADELGARRVTLPAISCGIYGYPLDEGARVALETVAQHLRASAGVEEATFVLRGEETFEAFAGALATLEGP
jgi:O-acetyl-ADP-ribose deacetylase (regulator of RNase III)